MNVRNLWKGLNKKFRRLLNETGYTCDYCGAEIFSYPEKRLCALCEEKLQRNTQESCGKCGRKTVTAGVCLTCKTEFPSFTHGFSPFVYRGEAASLINRMKDTVPRLAMYLGEQMADYFWQKADEKLRASQTPLLVVPVPMTSNKRRERGYNQALLLCEAFCDRLRTKGVETELLEDVLVKTRETVAQKHATAKERRKNVKGAFFLRKRTIFQDKTVVLIDDILTTGATSSECADRLLGAKAREVLLVVAAALPERK